MPILKAMGNARLESLLVVAVLVAACGGIDPQAELAAANEQLLGGDYRTAAIRVNRVLQAEPNNAAAYLLSGRIALAIGDATSARRELERAHRLGISPGEVAFPLADALLQLGAPDEALRLLDDSAASLDDDSGYWVRQADALTALGRLADAELALARVVSLGGYDVRSLLIRAQIEATRQRPDAALAAFDEALAMAPGDPETLAARGLFFVRAQRLEDAAADLRRAADAFEQRGPVTLREVAVLSTLVQVYLALNSTDDGAEIATRMSARVPDAAVTQYAAGLVAYHAGRLEEAAASLQSALSDQPNNTTFMTLLGAIHLALGQFGQAEQQFLRVLSSAPDEPAAIKLLAETRLRQSRPEAALDSLRSLSERGPADPQVDLLRGVANLGIGDFPQAVVYLEQAATRDPGNEALKLELARAYLAVAREADAVALLGTSFGTDSADAELSKNLLRLLAHVRSGELERGRADAEALAAEFPNDASALTAAAAFFRLIGERNVQQRLEQALRVDPAYLPARLLLAGWLVDEGRTPEAERQLRQALDTDPNHAQALIALAQLVTVRNDFAEADALLQRSPTLLAQVMRAQLYVRQQRFAEAEQVIDAAATLAPEHGDVAAVRGLLALATGRTGDALELLEEAHAALPGRLDVAIALARAQTTSGAFEAARQTLRAVLEDLPRSVAARAALGAVELRAGNGEAALAIASELQTDFPAESAGYALEAEVRIAQRRYDAAERSLAAAFDRKPSWELVARRSLALQLAGRAAAAEPLIEEWVAANPGDLQARLVLAGTLQANGADERALEHFRRVLDADPDNVAALNNSAWLLHEAEAPGALELAERAQRVAPDNAAVLDTLGWILTEQNREGDGIAYLRRAAQLAPQVPEIRYHMARAQAGLGQADEARATLRGLLAEDTSAALREAAEALLGTL